MKVIDKKEKRKIVGSQLKSLRDQGLHKIKVNCGECGKLTQIYYGACRCFYCGIYFCKSCAEEHFKNDNKK